MQQPFTYKTLTALWLGATAFIPGQALAASPEVPEYKLDQVLVTAQRYETREVNTAASTSVYTSEQLEATGAANVQEALKTVGGMVYSTYGPGGAAYGTMTSDFSIRGMSGGTLVLVNGMPLNLRGMYSLEDIALDTVERIEIVKGGGSVLYGSEATGGVINIITKASRQNSFKVSGGNFGQQNHSISLQNGKLGLGYSFEKWDKVGFISTTLNSSNQAMDTNFPGLERNNVSLHYQFNDALTLLYNYNNSKTRYEYYFGSGYAVEGKRRYNRLYDDTKQFVQLHYQHDHVKGMVYYNQKKLHSTGLNYYEANGSLNATPKAYDTEEDNRTYGFDVQRDWQINDNKLLLGATWQNEYFEDRSNTPSRILDYERNNYSVYGQWEQTLSEVNTLILSGRETWTAGAPNGRNYTNFSGQGQFIHKLGADETLYANVGQSFKMPTFRQIYGSGSNSSNIGNPHVKPQHGMHYELGWKKNHKAQNWRLALFHFDIEDNITHQKIENDQYKYTNEDYKNTGIELTCDIAANNGWTFNWGVSYSDPQGKKGGEQWDRRYGRWQVNGGATYSYEQWKVALTGNYLADRVMKPSSSPSYSQKPYLLTTLSVNYALDPNQDIFFTANNVLDRDDIVQHQSSDYYYTPFSFTLGYKCRF